MKQFLLFFLVPCDSSSTEESPTFSFVYFSHPLRHTWNMETCILHSKDIINLISSSSQHLMLSKEMTMAKMSPGCLWTPTNKQNSQTWMDASRSSTNHQPQHQKCTDRYINGTWTQNTPTFTMTISLSPKSHIFQNSTLQ